MARSDLGKRIAVAAVGIPAAVAAIYAGGWVLGAVLALVAAGATAELYRLSSLQGARPFVVPGVVAAAAYVLVAAAHPRPLEATPIFWALTLALLLAFSAAAIWARGVEGLPLEAVAVTVLGAAFTGGTLSYALFLRHLRPAGTVMDGALLAAAFNPWTGTALVLFPIAITWFNDSCAYFVGRAVGRHKLIPAVSPGKTVEGAVAGVVGSMLAGWIFSRWIFGGWLHVPMSAAAGLGGGLVVSIAAQLGDLAESLFKREAGVKDSGHLLPGHGGLLDRFDALFFTIPLAYWFLGMTLPYLGGRP
ncbi:MAG: phosphatidate cytidylyltransferase [Gemmatimonadetes bacterium]|nr:phosphatidate cytidylyltransferase [Gemmatimonadota bacterium]